MFGRIITAILLGFIWATIRMPKSLSGQVMRLRLLGYVRRIFPPTSQIMTILLSRLLNCLPCHHFSDARHMTVHAHHTTCDTFIHASAVQLDGILTQKPHPNGSDQAQASSWRFSGIYALSLS